MRIYFVKPVRSGCLILFAVFFVLFESHTLSAQSDSFKNVDINAEKVHLKYTTYGSFLQTGLPAQAVRQFNQKNIVCRLMKQVFNISVKSERSVIDVSVSRLGPDKINNGPR